MPLPIDPSNDKAIMLNVADQLGYYASVPAAVVGIAVFGTLALLFYRWIRGRASYMLWVSIGALVMTVGFAFRIPMHSIPTSIPIYIVQTLLILLSPCAFIAQDYYVLPHLANWLETPDCLPLKARLLGGTAMAASQDLATTGENIALVGLIVQLVSFGLYMCLWAWFGYSVIALIEQGVADRRVPWRSDWRSVYWALGWTCIGILIRCIYRVVEFAQGFDGYLRTTEWCFYVLDSLPLVCAMAVWVLVWPPSVLDSMGHPFGRDAGDIRMASMTKSSGDSTPNMPPNMPPYSSVEERTSAKFTTRP